MINSIDPSNQFVVLSSSKDKLEEGEIQHLEGFEVENEVSVAMDQVGPDFLSPKGVGEVFPAPVRPSSSPSYVEIARKKPIESSGSSDEESIDQFSKKSGRKSKKEIREEEAEMLKTQGSQSTIEMSYGQNKRTRPPKGVITPSNLSK